MRQSKVTSSARATGINENKDIAANSKDLEFIQSINSFIEKHLGNKDFVIEDIANEVI